MPRTVHIIGAGIAGLATAVRLASLGNRVSVREMANQAGGRCRSYHDPTLDMMIDNGNHLILSGNRAALAYLDTIGARDHLIGPVTARFPFIDLKTGERWILRANNGRIPWWILDPGRRVPGTRAPCGTTVPGTRGPRSLVHSGKSRASSAPASASVRHSRAVATVLSDAMR